MRAHETATGLAAAILASTALAWAPTAAAEPAAQYRADQIAQIEPADVQLESGSAWTVSHNEAAFIKARFEGVRLGPGDTITVASPGGGETHRYGPSDVEGGGLRALSIEGDTAEILLHDADDGVAASARLAAYSRGLNDAELASRPSGTEAGPESICGRDDSLNAACYKETDPVAWNASRSVARLIVDDESYCTAWIADNANRLMTNNHCLNTDEEARATEIQFGYECLACEGGETRIPIKVAGDDALTTDDTLDYTLFTVTDPAMIDHLPYLVIDPRGAAQGERVFIPGHPDGKPLRIAAASSSEPWGTGSHCRVHDAAADGIGRNTDLEYLCDTEAGSSGSPVLSRTTGAVIGLHHLGGCPNGAVRMDLIYPRVAPYLEYGR